MFKRKRIVALTLSLMTVLSLIGCSSTVKTNNNKSGQVTLEKPDPYGKYKDLITFSSSKAMPPQPKIPGSNTLEDNFFTKYIQDKLNVKVKYDWTVTGENNGYFNKLNMVIASNSLPDVFTCDINQLKRLSDAGMIEDLTKVYDDYASPTFKKFHTAANNLALKQASINGKLMAIPNLSPQDDQVPLLWVRQDWLDALNLKVPTNVDELVNVLTQFTQKDPGKNGAGKTIGITGVTQYAKNSMHGFDGVFEAFRSYPEQYFKGKDGKTYYGSVQPETKIALEKLAEMYKNKLIDKEWVLKDTGKSNDLLVQGKSGTMFHAWWGPNWPLGDTIKDNPNAKWTATYINSADGKLYPRGNALSYTYVAVKKGFKHPELAMKIINVVEDADLGKIAEVNTARAGEYKDSNVDFWPVNATSKYVDEILRQYKGVVTVLDGSAKLDSLNPDGQKIYNNIKLYKEDPVKNVEQRNNYLSWMVGAKVLDDSKYIQQFPSWTGATETQVSKGQTLLDLEHDTFIKIIVGKAPISEFDNYVKKWKELGGDNILKEIDQALK